MRERVSDGKILFDHYRRGIHYYAKNPWMKAMILVEVKKAVREVDDFTQEDADKLMVLAFPSERENMGR